MNADRISRLFGLHDQVAVVTDCGALSSTDVAPLLADAGARVVIADQPGAALDDLVQRIVDGGGRAVAIPTDVCDEASVRALFERVRIDFGRLDILVNCAGLSANQPLTETRTSLFDELVSLNLRSVFLLMREGVSLMREGGGGGRIVNVTTMGALHPVLHGNEAYGATRGGVTMLTRAAALDHASERILVNLVMPGAVAGKVRFHKDTLTRLQSGQPLTGPATNAEHRLPLGMGTGQDIAAAVLYLVGPAGAYITGQQIVLDGGFLLT